MENKSKLIDIIIKSNIRGFPLPDAFVNAATWCLDTWVDEYALAEKLEIDIDEWFELVDSRMRGRLNALGIETYRREFGIDWTDMLHIEIIERLVLMIRLQYNPKAKQALRRWAAINRIKRSPIMQSYIQRFLKRAWHPSGRLAQKGWVDLTRS